MDRTNTANPYVDAVSAISSDFATDYTPGQLSSLPTLCGLTPGANYVIYVDEILAVASALHHCPLPGPEEFYNNLLESSNSPLTT